MAPPLPPTASPASTVDSFGQPPKSHTDELLHLLELPIHVGMTPHTPHDQATPSFHLPRPSEEPADMVGIEATRFTPANHAGDTPHSIKPEPEDEIEASRTEKDGSEAQSRIGTASASPSPNTLGLETLPHHTHAQEDEIRYMLSPLASLVSSAHSTNSKTSTTDRVSGSSIASFGALSPCPRRMRQDAQGGLLSV